MSRPAVESVTPDGPALTVLPRVDFADAHEVSIDPALPSDPDWWRRKLFGEFGWPITMMLGLRDAVVVPFGVQPALGGMTRIPVVLQTPQEQVFMHPDKHLDFAVGVRVAEGRLRLTTTVLLRGWAGRIYFAPVRPIHAHYVVPSMLRRAQRLGSPAAKPAMVDG